MRGLCWGVLALVACRTHGTKTPEPERLTLGTPDPYWAVQVSPDGARILLCQAREDLDGNGRVASWRGLEGDVGGDRLAPYLVRSNGVETSISPVVGADTDLAQILVLKPAGLMLWDAVTDKLTDLKAPFRPADPEHGQMVASLDPRGRVVLFTRGNGLMALEVATGFERPVDSGPGLVLDATIHPDGEWVVLHKVLADSDGDGVLDGPPQVEIARDACGNPLGSPAPKAEGAEKRREMGDEVRTFVLPVGALLGTVKGPPEEIAGFEQVAGELVLVRKVDGTLAWSTGDDLTPPGCKPEVEQVLSRAQRILYKCQNGKIGLGGQGFQKWIDGSRETFTFLDFTDRHVRLVTLARGKKDRQKLTLVDTGDGATRPLARGERVLATAGSRALLHGPCPRGKDSCISVIDVITKEARWLPVKHVRPELVRCEMTTRTSDTVTAAGVVIDLATGKAMGHYLRCPVLVTKAGKLLYGTEHQVLGESGIPRGPLFWLDALPCKDDSCGFVSE